MEVKFLHCQVCGNLLIPAIDSGAVPVCCGKTMDLLAPGSTDAAVEKHVPVVKRLDDGKHVTVEIGSVPHPMVEEHYIQLVVLTYGDKFFYQKLAPGSEPSARFRIKDNTVPITAYAYCNLHGLWKSDI